MTGRPGCLVIVCGLPGSGKTTHARRLAAERHGVRLSPDEWTAALGVDSWARRWNWCTSSRRPTGCPDDAEMRLYDRSYRGP
ncbi:AAA family ATPase [Saccharothrix luteola]|uniref:AAA family ATPase n=1 Tax=Saccharothrix luteola TaxID=2893018 RepID=UPI001E498024|nr:AAA family ATPase [Saccharothrix luteola]MCC8245921.1 ATP-binding protein [Saccharothrix luteola]MCC8248319.1 ATP-binding protein [Saccharothrix luteola]